METFCLELSENLYGFWYLTNLRKVAKRSSLKTWEIPEDFLQTRCPPHKVVFSKIIIWDNHIIQGHYNICLALADGHTSVRVLEIVNIPPWDYEAETPNPTTLAKHLTDP